MGQLIRLENNTAPYHRMLSNRLERLVMGLILSSDRALSHYHVMCAARHHFGHSLAKVYETDIHNAIDNLMKKDALNYTFDGHFGLSRELKRKDRKMDEELRQQLIRYLSLHFPSERNVQLLHKENTGHSLYGRFADYCNQYQLRPRPAKKEEITIDKPVLQYLHLNSAKEEIIIMLRGYDMHFLGTDIAGCRQVFTAWPYTSKKATVRLFEKNTLKIMVKVFSGRYSDETIRQIFGLRAAI